MSLQSWQAKYMPFNKIEPSSELEALKWSLLKWVGLRPKNLKAHHVTHIPRVRLATLGDPNDTLDVLTSDNCALCHLHNKSGWSESCEDCSLYQNRLTKCYNDKLGDPSPYKIMLMSSNPEPMIKLIRNCIKNEIYNS